MMSIVKRFLADESGATAIEYGLIAASISLAIIPVVNGLGTSQRTKFTSISSSLHLSGHCLAWERRTGFGAAAAFAPDHWPELRPPLRR